MAKKEETKRTEEMESEEKAEEQTEEAKEQEEKTEKIEKSEKSTKKSEDERPGIAYIYSSSNNTIVHITDLAGNTISRISGGMVTKHSRLKANPTIAMFVAKKASERARDLGINALYVRLRGKTEIGSTGPGAHAAVKALGKEGFRVINILDATKYPHGGPKKPHGKRGRRV